MLTNVFLYRDRNLSTLIKFADLLGRSLRENVELFSIEDNSVTYVTESSKVIKANYKITSPVHLYNIEVESASIFEDKDKFSTLVDSRVSNFLSDIIENDYSEAEVSFDKVLTLWETRMNFDRVRQRLEEKTSHFSSTASQIINTPEFSRLVENKDALANLLKENKDLVNVPEIRNAVKMARAVSNAFSLPRVTYESLQEEGVFFLPGRNSASLYEHLCQQELLKKELLEAKTNMENIWADNENVMELASLIGSDDNEKILEQLAKVILDVPYFALSTKKQISSLIQNTLGIMNLESFNKTEQKKFVGKLYEAKKPVKDHIVSLLSEKYGINVGTLSEAPTFFNLAKTEVVILEALSKIAPRNSTIKKILGEAADMLRGKVGVETIDISDFLNEVFKNAGYKEFVNETSLMNYLDFERVADDLGKIGAVLKMIKQNMQGGEEMPMDAGAEMGMEPELGGEEEPMPGPDNPLAGEGQYEPDMSDLESELATQGPEDDDIAPAEMDAEDAAAEADDEVSAELQAGSEPEVEPEMGLEDEEEGENIPNMEEDDLIGNLKELEALMADLKDELGMGELDSGEEDVDLEEPVDGEEDNEEVEINVDVDDEGVEEEDDEADDEDEEFPPKKK